MKIKLFLFVAVFISCSSKNVVSKKQLDKVELGMTTTEVSNILGSPYYIGKTADSFYNYCYYIKNDLLGTESAIVKFDKSEKVTIVYYDNPN